jgi:hypothetical protein
MNGNVKINVLKNMEKKIFSGGQPTYIYSDLGVKKYT